MTLNQKFDFVSRCALYVKNISAKVHPDPFWNDVYWRRSPQQEEQDE